jgi:D-tyrosyl-tRNA(Tyr) deacylase
MRAVVQRCSTASVSVEKEGRTFISGSLDQGLMVYVGVGREDREEDAAYLADRIAHLRIFMDEEEKMNLSVLDLKLGILVVSQFTLFADARKGRRPSFSEAADNESAKALYEKFCQNLSGYGLKVETGIFREMMKVTYTNEGPITILLDSKKTF